MKKISTLLFCLLLAASLCGCNSSKTVLSKETSTDTSWAMSYKSFDGTKSKDLTVSDGESVDVQVSVVTDDGSLDITIGQSGEDPAYQGSDLDTGDFTVTLSEPGTYTISVTADNHSGSYNFSWD